MEGLWNIITEINRVERRKRYAYFLVPIIIGIFLIKKYNHSLEILYENLKKHEKEIKHEIASHVIDIKKIYQSIKNENIILTLERKSLIWDNFNKHYKPLIELQKYNNIFSSEINSSISSAIKVLSEIYLIAM